MEVLMASDTMQEFVIEWGKGDMYAFITVPSGTALKTKIMKLADKYPSEVEIVKINDDGSMYSRVPVKYVTVRHPKVVSEETRRKAAERLKIVRMERYEKSNTK